MAIYKVTFGLSQANIGASETYYAISETAVSIGPVVTQLAELRNAMLMSTTQWTGIRVALCTTRNNDVVGERRSLFYIPGTYTFAGSGIELTVPSEGLLPVTDKTKRSDQGRACLQCRVIYDTDRATTRYMAFVPDGVLYDEPYSYRPNDYVGWSDKFNLFRALLCGGKWGVRGKSRGTGFGKINITSWVQAGAPPANIGVKVPAAPAPGIVEGDFVSIAGVRRKGTDTLSYNGRYIVDGVNTTLFPDYVVYYLRGTEAGNPQSVKLAGTIQKIGHQIYPITNWIGWRAGVHKRGRPFGLLQGRSKKRLSLDP